MPVDPGHSDGAPPPVDPQLMEQVTVRSAVPADIDQLDRFIQPFVDEGRLLPRTPEELTELVRHGFVAERNGALVGFCALEVYSRKLGEIRSLAVIPELRGRGVGRLLVAACVQRATDLHVLEVMAITSSDEFFRSCGFDFTLPGEKKALFLQTRESPYHPELAAGAGPPPPHPPADDGGEGKASG
jgi:amino-acid N-acetyltransferase